MNVIGRTKYKLKRVAPDFTRERDETMKMLINSCIGNLEHKGEVE